MKGKRVMVEPETVEDPKKLKRMGKRMSKRKGRRKSTRY